MKDRDLPSAIPRFERGRTGTISGTQGTDWSWSTNTFSSGNSKYSLHFNGNGYSHGTITSANPIGIANTSFTITEWINTTSAGGQMYTTNANSGGSLGFRFGLAGGEVAFLIGNGSSDIELLAVQRWPTTVRGTIFRAFDRNAGTFTCYIDGNQVGAVTVPAADYSGGIGNQNVTIGDPLGEGTGFVGYLDNVRYISRISPESASGTYTNKPSHGTWP